MDGPTAIAYSNDPVELTKLLSNFAKNNSNLVILGGIMNNEILSVEKIDKIMGEKKPIYDLKVDQRISKFNKGQKLTTIDLKLLPNYIQNNIEKYKLWLD